MASPLRPVPTASAFRPVPAARRRRPVLAASLLAALLACDPPPSPPSAEPAVAPAPAPVAPAPAPVDTAAPPAPAAPSPPVDPPAPASDPPAAPAEPPATLTIVDRPIRYDDARIRRTIAYRQRHQDPAIRDTTIDPKLIILHHTGGTSLEATWRYFDRPTVEKSRKRIAGAGDLNVSAHFLVGQDGAVVRLMPETQMARHCVGLNHLAIGVENVGDPKRAPLTQAQVDADIALVRDLKRRFPGITHLIGHHEYLALEGHPYFRELDPDYRTRKGDPGPAFMARVRAGLVDLGLEGPPARP